MNSGEVRPIPGFGVRYRRPMRSRSSATTDGARAARIVHGHTRKRAPVQVLTSFYGGRAYEGASVGCQKVAKFTVFDFPSLHFSASLCTFYTTNHQSSTRHLVT